MIKQILGLVVLFALSGGAAYAGNPGDQTTSSVFDFTGAGQPGNTTLVRTPPGLIDPHGAEVHLVLRSHGPAVSGMLADQIGSFEGGCAVFLDPPEIAYEAGECSDIHASIHAP